MERLTALYPGDLSILHEDRFEEGVVVPSPHDGRREEVADVEVVRELRRDGDQRLSPLELGVLTGKLFLNLGHLGGDALVLDSKAFKR